MKDFICINPFINDEFERRKTIRSKFEEQLYRFRVVTTTPKQAHSIPKQTVSGKVDKEGKISGMFQDDLVMSFTMNLYIWEELIFRRVPNFPYQMVFNC